MLRLKIYSKSAPTPSRTEGVGLLLSISVGPSSACEQRILGVFVQKCAIELQPAVTSSTVTLTAL